MGSVSGKSVSDYDSYDESELSDEEIDNSFKKPIDNSFKKPIDNSFKKPIDNELSDQDDIVDNVFDRFEEILDDHKKIVDEMFDSIERVLLKGYEEDEGYEEEDYEDEGYEEDQQIDMSDSIIALFETKSPMDLL